MRMLFRSEKRNSLLKNQLKETTFGVSGMEQMILMREQVHIFFFANTKEMWWTAPKQLCKSHYTNSSCCADTSQVTKHRLIQSYSFSPFDFHSFTFKSDLERMKRRSPPKLEKKIIKKIIMTLSKVVVIVPIPLRQYESKRISFFGFRKGSSSKGDFCRK